MLPRLRKIIQEAYRRYVYFFNLQISGDKIHVHPCDSRLMSDFRFLASSGADPNTALPGGRTSFTRFGYIQPGPMAGWLLEHGAGLNPRYKGMTLLVIAQQKQ